MNRPELTEAGRAYAAKHAADSMVANVAHHGYENSTWPEAHVATAIAACNTSADAPRFKARYRDGYYVVVDTTTGEVVPPEPGHYKRHRDGYLWDYAAAYAAEALNQEVTA